MASTRIIADSDDSDDDFDLGDSPPKHPTSKLPTESRSFDPASAATSSTDLQVFQEIYNEQRRVATSEGLPHPDSSLEPNNSGPNSGSLGVLTQTKQDIVNISSLTSVTDPTMGPNLAKKPRKLETVDLTQVTTPGRSTNNTPKDMWEVPSSPIEQEAAAVGIMAKNKTPSSSKRKRGNNVEFTSPLATAMPSQGSTQPFDTTPAGRGNFALMEMAKKQKLDILVSSAPAEDDVDMIIPRENSSVIMDAPVSGQKPVSLYIEPRSLSASQQRQYEYYSVNPSPDDLRPEPSRHFTTQQMTTRSSGATTIAYSTPSQTRVRGGLQDSFSNSIDSERNSQQDQEIPEEVVPFKVTAELQSSPDIISAAPVRRQKSKAQNSCPRVSESQTTEKWPSDSDGFHGEELYKPRSSRRRGSDTSRQSDAQNATCTEAPVADMRPFTQGTVEEVAPINPTQAKKRGRPRKSDAAVTAGPTDSSLAWPRDDVGDKFAENPAAADSSTAVTQQTKKKRGRPRKTDKMLTDSVQQASEEQHAVTEPADQAKENLASMDSEHACDERPPEQAEHATKAKNRDREKKSRCTDEMDEARALQATTHDNGVVRAGSDGPDPQKTATEGNVAATAASITTGKKDEEEKELVGKGKADGKQGGRIGASCQVVKPLYRVGLSKKSKIAPLLKIVRK
ncbi:threonine synthase [Colletotrichum truncatum]|uniref:Threonine synthase n=1 Tax=Colletotrichum truncatum TaxID=5467 RepID=A0ACC3ZAL8_COLTU|nr:threonine synthase [Colletotrichum truncatum]KAF6796298.1 threonine synthase [Colletotrichum truncatum]